MKFEKLGRRVRVMALLGVVVMMTGCGMVQEGNFAVEKYWGGQTNKEAVMPGIHPFDDVLDSYTEIYGREYILQIPDIKPKDKDGVLLKDLDLSVSYRVNPKLTPTFLVKESQDLLSDPTKDGMIVGSQTLKREIMSLINQTTQKFGSREMLMNQEQFEKQLLLDIQTVLNAKYGNIFQLSATRVSSIVVADSIELRIQSIAAMQAQEGMANAAESSKKDKERSDEAAILPLANAYKNVSTKTGVSIRDLMEMQKIEALKNTTISPVINVGSSSSAPGPK